MIVGGVDIIKLPDFFLNNNSIQSFNMAMDSKPQTSTSKPQASGSDNSSKPTANKNVNRSTQNIIADIGVPWWLSGILNPPLLNSIIQKQSLPTDFKPSAKLINTYRPDRVLISQPNKRSYRPGRTPGKPVISIKPAKPAPFRTPATNPMFFFGSSILGFGFGVSLIPSVTMAATELGLIEDRDSWQYQMESTF